MKEGHSKEAIMMAIRRSLKGEPANILMRLWICCDDKRNTVEVQQYLWKRDGDREHPC
jgi:hypothetical protein